MTVLMGLDSTSPVAVSAHQAIGSTVAIRYLSRSTSKAITRSEYLANCAAGIHTCLVFEDSATNAKGGYDAGKADAEYGLKQAIDILGKPLHSAPRFPLAVDYDPTGIAAETDPYFDGTAAVLGHPNTGPYGGYDMVAHAQARLFGLLFGTYAWSAGREVSGQQWFQFSNDHFVGGVGVDYDHCYPDKTGDLGNWDFKPLAPPDPYGVYSDAPYPWKGRLLREKQAAMRYDDLRNHGKLRIMRNSKELAALRVTLGLCAERVYFEAHWGKAGLPGGVHHGMPPRWRWEHSGHRFQGCIRRHQGEALHI